LIEFARGRLSGLRQHLIPASYFSTRRRTMKKKVILLCGLAFCLMSAGDVCAQGKYVRKTVKQYWEDGGRRPWNDFSYNLAIRIDPQFAITLGANEISSDDNPALTYAVGEWKHFSLKRDAGGTYAEPEVLVYEDKDEPITYQVELQKDGKAVPFAFGSSKVDISNSTPNLGKAGSKQYNTIFLKDWMVIAGTMLLGAILLYFLVFRQLFRSLLFNRRWGVSKAENFTWSLSLLGLLGLSAALTLFYLGPRLETWIVMGVMGAFWLLHSIVWLASGKEA
jgi:hypothetical protein